MVLELFVIWIQVMRPNHGDEYDVLELNPMEWTFDNCPKVKFFWCSFLNVFPICFYCFLSFAGLLTTWLCACCGNDSLYNMHIHGPTLQSYFCVCIHMHVLFQILRHQPHDEFLSFLALLKNWEVFFFYNKKNVDVDLTKTAITRAIILIECFRSCFFIFQFIIFVRSPIVPKSLIC